MVILTWKPDLISLLKPFYSIYKKLKALQVIPEHFYQAGELVLFQFKLVNNGVEPIFIEDVFLKFHHETIAPCFDLSYDPLYFYDLNSYRYDSRKEEFDEKFSVLADNLNEEKTFFLPPHKIKKCKFVFLTRKKITVQGLQHLTLVLQQKSLSKKLFPIDFHVHFDYIPYLDIREMKIHSQIIS